MSWLFYNWLIFSDSIGTIILWYKIKDEEQKEGVSIRVCAHNILVGN